MFSQKQLDNIEKDIDKSLEQASKKMVKYFIEHKGKEYKPLNTYFGVGDYLRMYPRHDVGCLVVASIEVNQKKQGKGYFKSFYNLLEKIAYKKEMRIIFESVLNPKLQSFLEREGYINYNNSGTFYKDYTLNPEIKILNEREELDKIDLPLIKNKITP